MGNTSLTLLGQTFLWLNPQCRCWTTSPTSTLPMQPMDGSCVGMSKLGSFLRSLSVKTLLGPGSQARWLSRRGRISPSSWAWCSPANWLLYGITGLVSPLCRLTSGSTWFVATMLMVCRGTVCSSWQIQRRARMPMVAPFGTTPVRIRRLGQRF